MFSTIKARTLACACAALLGAAWTLSPVSAAAHPADQTGATQQDVAADQRATITVEANVRAQPNTNSTVLTTLPVGAGVTVECWTTGEPTFGNDLYGSMWLLTSLSGWIHSKLVSAVDVPECDAATVPSGLVYENCDAAREAGAAPVYRNEPGYGEHLDADNDGIGCEPYYE